MSFVGLAFMWNKLGLSPYGTCSTSSKVIYAVLALPVFYIFYGCYTLRKIKKGLPEMTDDKKIIMESLTSSYRAYICVNSLLWFSIGVILIMGTYYKSHEK
jgi:hypothetical protein